MRAIRLLIRLCAAWPLAAAPAVASAAPPVIVKLEDLAGLVGEAPEAAPARLPQIPRDDRLTCDTASPARAAERCRFVHRVGDVDLAPSLALADGARIDGLTLHVVAGRVTAVTFRASPDAFAALRRTLSARFGAPRVGRGALKTPLGPRPQVTLTWGSRALMVDPAGPDLGIEVQLTEPRRSA